MRPDMGSSAVALFLIAVIAAAVFFAVRGIIRYAQRRESDRREMLELLRGQRGRGDE